MPHPIIARHGLYDSGCSSLRQLNGPGTSDPRRYSTDLFRGLCQTDVVGRLSHDYARGTAIDLARASEDDESA
ncbi:hypothetical protein ACHAXA_004799 [Cyclostephanos tholiformis]|uniref:Uncharacterized protein n=1 Tax=Cyclostephanos tholiformis TaxID=382380 RepID=A0ABD3R9X6_9STRA